MAGSPLGLRPSGGQMTLTQFVASAAAVALGLFAVMTAAWWIQQFSGRSGLVDTFWTFGVGGSAVVAALLPLSGRVSVRQIFVAALAAIWSLRLGSHIVRRNGLNGDDPRYRHMIEEWGADAARRMFCVPAVPGGGWRRICPRHRRGGAQSSARLAMAGFYGRAHRAWRDIGRMARRSRTAAAPGRSDERRRCLRCRFVALVTPSELFLRMAFLVCFSGYRDRYVWTQFAWMVRTCGSYPDVLAARPRVRYPSARAAHAAIARRQVSRLPASDLEVFSVAAAPVTRPVDVVQSQLATR